MFAQIKRGWYQCGIQKCQWQVSSSKVPTTSVKQTVYIILDRKQSIGDKLEMDSLLVVKQTVYIILDRKSSVAGWQIPTADFAGCQIYWKFSWTFRRNSARIFTKLLKNDWKRYFTYQHILIFRMKHIREIPSPPPPITITFQISNIFRIRFSVLERFPGSFFRIHSPLTIIHKCIQISNKFEIGLQTSIINWENHTKTRKQSQSRKKCLQNSSPGNNHPPNY